MKNQTSPSVTVTKDLLLAIKRCKNFYFDSRGIRFNNTYGYSVYPYDNDNFDGGFGVTIYPDDREHRFIPPLLKPGDVIRSRVEDDLFGTTQTKLAGITVSGVYLDVYDSFGAVKYSVFIGIKYGTEPL